MHTSQEAVVSEVCPNWAPANTSPAPPSLTEGRRLSNKSSLTVLRKPSYSKRQKVFPSKNCFSTTVCSRPAAAGPTGGTCSAPALLRLQLLLSGLPFMATFVCPPLKGYCSIRSTFRSPGSQEQIQCTVTSRIHTPTSPWSLLNLVYTCRYLELLDQTSSAGLIPGRTANLEKSHSKTVIVVLFGQTGHSDGINNSEAEAFFLFEHLPPAIFFLTISSSLSGSAKHPKVGRKNEREGSPAPVHTYAHFRALETVDKEAKFKDTNLKAQKKPEQALVRALSRLTER